MMPQISSLPTEIIVSIFQHLFNDFDLHCDRSIFNAMRVCRGWRETGTGIGFNSIDGKTWKFTDEFCEMRRILEYDDREVQMDPDYCDRISQLGSWQSVTPVTWAEAEVEDDDENEIGDESETP